MNAIAPPRRHPPRMRASAPVTFATLLAVVSLIAALAQGLVAPQPAHSAPEDFVDVLLGHSYYVAVEGLYQAGVADGYPVAGGKEFRPGNPLWRRSSPR